MLLTAFLPLLLAHAGRGDLFGIGGSSSSETCDDDTDFKCESGDCVRKTRWCDSFEDCEDGSDEEYCSKSVRCPDKYFQCTDGGCIPLEGKCDGINSCKDRSDETVCKTTTASSLHYSFEKKVSKAPSRKVYNTDPLERAKDWILSQREDGAWRKDTTRAILGLYFADKGFFKSESSLSNLISKELNLEIALAIQRNKTKAISLPDLSLYINALLATCQNPRNFHGLDLTVVLRQRTNALLATKAFMSPIIHLTLCLTGNSVYGDFQNLYEEFIRRNWNSTHYGLQALGVIAAACLNKLEMLQEWKILQTSLKRLESNLNNEKLWDIYTSALVYQALHLSYSELDIKDELKDYIVSTQNENGSFGDISATYLALPAVSGYGGLESLNETDCLDDDGLIPLERLKNAEKKIVVPFSLYIGETMNPSFTTKLKLPDNISFFNVMRLAAEENAQFRFDYEITDNIRIISIGPYANDAEKGLFWTPYRVYQSRESNGLTKVDHDIRRVYLSHGDQIAYWYTNP